VAKVPHREDLTPAELVGKTTEFLRDTSDGNETKTETIRGVQKAIIRPGISVVKIDEINRTSPAALNASLEFLQNGYISVGDNEDRLSDDTFDLVLSTQNHYGTAYTFRLDPATGGRLAMGAIVGRRERGKLSEVGEKMWDEPSKQYDGKSQVESVIERTDLHKGIRKYIDHVELAKPEREFGKSIAANALDALKDSGMNQGDGRIMQQLIRISRMFSMFDGLVKVSDDNIREAVKYGMTSRLVSMGRYQTEEIDDIVKNVTDR
jgi:MoxR-like ATPase